MDNLLFQMNYAELEARAFAYQIKCLEKQFDTKIRMSIIHDEIIIEVNDESKKDDIIQYIKEISNYGINI